MIFFQETNDGVFLETFGVFLLKFVGFLKKEVSPMFLVLALPNSLKKLYKKKFCIWTSLNTKKIQLSCKHSESVWNVLGVKICMLFIL